MDGDVQSWRFSGSVLTVREKTSGAFAVLGVGAPRLLEQSESREHGGQSSNSVCRSRQSRRRDE